MLGAVLLLLLTCGLSIPAAADDLASAGIVRLSEREFETIPDVVREFMRRRQCLVPQPWDRVQTGEGPSNVVSGSFASSEQIDWVMLCSRDGNSAIHAHWGGPARCPEPISEQSDASFLQGIGNGRSGFSREIFRLSPGQIRQRYEYWRSQPEAEGEKVDLPRVEHDAIDDAFVPKASSTLYCRRGEWQQLLGAD